MVDGLFHSSVEAEPAAYARVAVERALDRYPDGLTYAIPTPLEDIAPGDRVRVPLGRGHALASGCVVEIMSTTPLERSRIRAIESREDVPRLPRPLIELARWISRYYITPLGVALSAVLPAPVKHQVGRRTVRLVEPGAADQPGTRRSPQQRAVLDALARTPADEFPIDIRELASAARVRTLQPIDRLLKDGLLRESRRTRIEAKWADPRIDATTPARLTPAQAAVIAAIGDQLEAGYSGHLLFGVTGSGKTEVYVRLIERVLAHGRTALVLVPEIALTPQTGARLLGRFPGRRVAVLHSALTAAQRSQQWDLVASGDAEIILGARSAVFAPIPENRLGLLIVDEEHDGSYKQDQMPRYHGRDVAIRRAQIEACPIVLGSATPALESWFNATRAGRLRLHRLPHRVPGMQLPAVEIVDLADERRARGAGTAERLLGPRLELALQRCLAEDGQALLLLNRRGFASYTVCADPACGWILSCAHCDVSLVHHRDRRIAAGGFARCHHCLTETRLPTACPRCGRALRQLGLGTQRAVEELEAGFPDLRDGVTMLRIDSDSMHGARDLHESLDRFGRGEIRVLLGTQMIAKGLDFPRVRLVGVLNADTAANLPDFRASERTFQLVSQVAGRSGRTTDPLGPARVIVQSFRPDMTAIRLAAGHDYETFAEGELEERIACGLPPATRMARIVTRDEELERSLSLAHAVADGLRRRAPAAIRVIGPAPCPIPRIADRFRHQVEILGPSAGEIHRLLTDARSEGVLTPGRAMAIDVDPIALL